MEQQNEIVYDPNAIPWERRAQLAEEFLKPFTDTEGRLIGGYEAAGLVRQLAGIMVRLGKPLEPKPKLTREQMIDHLVFNVPQMSKLSYSMYFGRPTIPAAIYHEPFLRTHKLLCFLRDYARKQLEAEAQNIDILYDDAEGNEDLLWPPLKLKLENKHLDTLRAAIRDGALWDGDLPSKSARDELVEVGYMVRLPLKFEAGYNAITYEGAEVLCHHYGASSTLDLKKFFEEEQQERQYKENQHGKESE